MVPITPAALDPAASVLSGRTLTSYERPQVRGKFLFAGDDKLYIRGVTYGPFRADTEGSQYRTPELVDRDFAQMAEHGINAVRCYTIPPRWLLDIANDRGLWVMVGLPWEQHVTFLDDRKRSRSIEEQVRAGVRACAGHPAVLCYAIGNEVPAPIVRWYGREPIERFLERLYRAAKAEDPQGLVTYVNYPSTEYLQLPFLDFCCFNVYLESQSALEAYLARLQNLADEKPLVMAEIGLDSHRNGEEVQAESLDWQVRTAFASGCAGAIVFSWTDEWHRGGHDVDDWAFGLVRLDRSQKPALATVRRAFAEVPFPAEMDWPRISVVVCSYNGALTIAETLAGLQRLDYPDFELIVVNDGSTDSTDGIACQSGVRLISTENRGLGSARNTGLRAATGDIVAYIDDDAHPDPHWLQYLAAAYIRAGHAGVGGPNPAPPGDGVIADCVANAPGGPVHVLVTDTEAEHIPGCNMSFRKEALEAVGGFDDQFRVAGDDVDLCWRLLERGWTLGFHPAALVWHHSRNSVGGYWKQQHNYGRAERMLEMKWPAKYSSYGRVGWRGRLYGPGLHRALMFRRWRVHHGVWGTGLFQSIYELAPGRLSSMPLMSEWYLVVAGLVGLTFLGLLWRPLLLAAPLALLALGLLLAQAILNGMSSPFAREPLPAWGRRIRYATTVFLYLLQPLARLSGRLRTGVLSWRRWGKRASAIPRPRMHSVWSEQWRALDERLSSVVQAICAQGGVVQAGGEFDRWDLEVRGGLFGSVRAQATVEEHGGGRQLLRLRSWPRFGPWSVGVTILAAGLAALAAADGVLGVASVFAFLAVVVVLSGFANCATAMASLLHGLEEDRMGGGQLLGAQEAVLSLRPVRDEKLPPPRPEAMSTGEIVR